VGLAAVQSDLRNLVTTQIGWAYDHEGRYATLPELSAAGWPIASGGVTLVIDSTTAAGLFASGRHIAAPGKKCTIHYDGKNESPKPTCTDG
jgi:hypothetical protein